jgi:hypothetical protein
MRLDHVSYVASHDQLSDVVQRIGSRLGSTFVDGGIHPRFGTRNFTMPLKNGYYLEVVCPLDHPAADKTPFGKAVTKRANEGGGWLTWVVSCGDIKNVEERIGRESVEGHRKRPDGTELHWKQIGVLNTIEDSQLPFFVEWLTNDHPSADGKPVAAIAKIEIAGDESTVEDWLGVDIAAALEGIEVQWIDVADNDGETGVVAIHLTTPQGTIRLD